MNAIHHKTILMLALESALLVAPAWAATPASSPLHCQVDTTCTPCEKRAKTPEEQSRDEDCRRVNGKRIDRGASLGARPGAPNSEQELGNLTFVLSDAMPEAESVADGSGPRAPLETRRSQRTRLEPGARQARADLFDSGYDRVNAALQSRLEAVVADLKDKANLRLEVVGHTDPQPLSVRSRERFGDNQGLGLARARMVATWLAEALGVPVGSIAVASKGPDEPVADNDTPEGMARNRRVEIHARFDTAYTEEVVEQVMHPVPPVPVRVAPAPLQSCQQVLATRQAAAAAPFRISVDGVPLNDSGTVDPDVQRCTDLALERSDIQIRYDALDQTPVLNAHAWPNAVARSGQVEITPWSNYAAFIQRSEIRIFAPDQSTQAVPLAVLSARLGEPVAWSPAGLTLDSVRYVLRVYDREGRFDETRPKTLDLVDQARPAEDADKRQRELLAGYGENSLALHNIAVKGGAVTVNGQGIQAGETVHFLGQAVPVDAKGAFAVRQILPAGNHVVEVQVADEQGSRARFSRNLSIARDDWFYLGIADLTLGRNSTSGPAKLVTADETDHFDNQVYLDGRLAFYLKGKIKGEWLLTASADTREQPLKDLFSNFADKDPRYLLRRLDPDKYYPVYGDDSTTVDDAPTQGKFFVRLEKGDSQVMWGSFQTSLTGTEFTRFNRALYGARGRLVSDAVTLHGEKKGTLEVFAADPGTLQSREEFRGTGGSLYYLRHIDITGGSERAWIEVRDKDTGLVLSTQQLVPVQDYEVNALQGRVILRQPLSSIAGAGTLVQNGSLGGHHQFLVVTYEYAPGVSAPEDLVLGGRGSVWVNDHVQIGATALRQDESGQKQRLRGLDATLRYKPGTYVKVEGARSDGVGSGAWSSLDGGFSFNAVPGNGAKADAQRVEAAVDFAEVGSAKGKATFYWHDREAGFSGPGQITAEAITQTGASVSWNITEQTELLAKIDDKNAASQDRTIAEVDISQRLDEHWKVAVGVRHDNLDTQVANASSTLSQTGDRTDAVVRVDYTPGEGVDWSTYGYLQGTVDRDDSRDRNNRIGFGGERRINDRLKLGGELSEGNGGLGAKLSGDWQVDDRTSLYSSYTLTTDRTDDGYRGRAGLFTAGGRSRFTDSLSVFSEEHYQHGEGPAGLTHAFGLDYSPDDRWTYGAKLEAGELNDPLAGDMDRRAVGLSLGYRKDATRYAGALEYRHEKGSTTRDTWLMKHTLGYQIDPDWRFLGRLNLSVSDSSAGGDLDGKYAEVVAGWAWRPVANDRWNTLFKYTYLYNLPSPGQVGSGGASLDYAQKSHVLAVDTIHDLKPWVSVGGKLGVRRGSLKDAKVGGDWYHSTAWLGVLRADWHWVHEWDVLTELRYLSVSEAEDSQAGALVGVYRHLDKHFKLGVGYNFTDFSDDLTDLSYHSHGWFINLIGKF
ncbi:MAG: OmpA family protein [Pseudomonadota bacterium]